MIHRLISIIILTALLSCNPCIRGLAQSDDCCRMEMGLQEGDLLFQPNGASAFSKAISEATSCCCMDFVHVGIFAIIDGDSAVIEASSKAGVVVTPLKDFLKECVDSGYTTEHSCNMTTVMAMRYPDSEVAHRAVQRALSVLGQPYDWEFAADNDRMYCSELVQYSFVDGDGNAIFESIPMNFADSEGDFPDFWTDLFTSMGKPIPQNAPGTNPNSIYAHPTLVPVKF